MIITLSLLLIAGIMMPMHYSSSSYRASNITTGTNNTYPIYLTGVPKGNGTYQQLITIDNYSKFDINNKGSNIEFYDYYNLTRLYAWIQSINTTSMQVWIKNYNGSSTIDMQVLPSFEDLFSATGYLGNISFNNAINVFDKITGARLKSYITPLANETTTIDNNNLNFSTSSVNYLYYFLTNIKQLPIFFVNETYYGTIVANNSNEQWGLVIDSNINTSFNAGNEAGPTGLNYLSRIVNSVSITPQEFEGSDCLLKSNHIFNYTYTSTDYLVKDGENLFASFNNIKVNVSTSYLNNGYIGFYLFSAVANITIAQVHYILIPTPNLTMPTFTIGTSLYHSIDFKLIGSSTSFQWSISINGIIYNATSSNIYLNMTNGYYNIIVNIPSQYSAIANGVLNVNNANEIFRITVVSQNSNNFSNDIMYAIILASIIIAVALYFSRRN